LDHPAVEEKGKEAPGWVDDITTQKKKKISADEALFFVTYLIQRQRG
jgi:hypothetical protein